MCLDEYFSSLAGKRIGVIGLGVSNKPLTRLLLEHGCDVTVCDKRGKEELGAECSEFSAMGCKFRLASGYLDDLDFDIIFRTPGLHPSALSKATENCRITSEMEAFFAVCPCRIIAVTGSDGKTTTSTIISELLKSAGHKVWLGGNIGTPLLDKVGGMRKEDIAVLELSSFQLHSMSCCPDIAVVTNISPNHLDVHPSYDDYIDAKKNVFLSQTADCRLILNRDNGITRGFESEAAAKVSFFSRKEEIKNGCCCHGGLIYRYGRKLMEAGDILIPGEHNIENMMAAFAATEGLVPDEVCREVAMSFGGVAHRLELIRQLNGVKFYNDSIATSPTRTIAGLMSFGQKVILIAGGHDKNISFDALAAEIREKVSALFLTGETAEKIARAVKAVDPEGKIPVVINDDFKETVLAAARSAGEGDIVILSPACSSFDRFKNFVERGNTFKKIVEELS